MTSTHKLKLSLVMLAVCLQLSLRVKGWEGETPPSVSLGLPAIPFPQGNPFSRAKYRLGEKLFFDAALSINDQISCASCHRPERAFTDPSGFSIGVSGKRMMVKTPTILNTAYSLLFFHDGRTSSLEDQAAGPLLSADEMGMTREGLESKLNGIPEYRHLFQAAFGAERITFGEICAALATYVRCQISGGTAFDEYIYGRDATKLSSAEKRGYRVFIGKAGCVRCHSFDGTGALFSDNSFHNIGIGFDQKNVPPGLFTMTGTKSHIGLIKTPSLRNVAITSPYMHDGRFKSLSEVIEYYNKGGIRNPGLSPLMRRLHLTKRERRDLGLFLQTLTDPRYLAAH